MELRILFSSIKRWWVPIALAAIAVSQIALLISLTGNATSTARSSLIIQPPASSLGGNINFADPDRYVDTQLTVLKSPAITNRVMQSLQLVGDVSAVSSRVQLAHVPKSDLVKIFATAGTDKEAIDLANAYASEFIKDQDSRLVAARGPELEVISNRLQEIGKELRLAEDLVYNDPSDSAARVDRDSLLVEYTELVRSKTAYEFTNRARVNTSVAEFASSAERSGVRSPLKWTLLGLIIGGLLAAAVSVAWSWLSPNVVDERQLGELVGSPVGPKLPWLRPDVPNRAWFLRPNSPNYISAVKDICIRADNAVPLSVTFKIAVVGVKRGLGTSGLSVSIASFFSRSAQVMLVDGNSEDSDLSSSFDSFDGERISNIQWNGAEDKHDLVKLRALQKRLPETSIDFIGGLAPRMNRFNVETIVGRLQGLADVLVVDCAPSTESALTVAVCEVADVVVLVVPPRRLSQQTIRQFVAQVGDTPVIAVVSGGRRGRTKKVGASRSDETEKGRASSRTETVGQPEQGRQTLKV
jgi:Mrp family chromosome partitioning ATPase